MNMPLLYLAAAVLGFSTTACKKDPATTGIDSVVFGSFYGECLGERCIEVYKLDLAAQHLYEDTQDHYPGATPYNGTFVLRADSLYVRVQDLGSRIPAQLLRQPNAVIGQPDAGDWGGYYLEVNRNGRQQVWLIDTKKDNLPTYLHGFVDELQARLELIP